MNRRSLPILLASLLACSGERDPGGRFEVQVQGAAGMPQAEAGSGGGPAGAGSGGSPAGGAGDGGGGVGGEAGVGNGGAGGAGEGGTGDGGSAGSGAGAGGDGGGGGGGGDGGMAGGGDAGGVGGAAGDGPCPEEMAWIADGFCVDRWEAQVEVEEGGVWKIHSPYEVLDGVSGALRARSAPGVVPQGYISGAQARAACEGAGKRLCTRAEFRRACQGPDEATYPYGDVYQEGACNEGRKTHPIIELFGNGPGVFNSTNMNDPAVNQLPDSLAPTGAHDQCVSAEGAFDMHGNLHEWVDEDEGTFCGGFYVDAKLNGPGCLYTTTAHAIGYHDYSTGFRCCLGL